MKLCPYCGYGNDKQAVVCEKCRAELPVAKTESEQPKKADKKTNKE